MECEKKKIVPVPGRNNWDNLFSLIPVGVSCYNINEKNLMLIKIFLMVLCYSNILYSQTVKVLAVGGMKIFLCSC